MVWKDHFEHMIMQTLLIPIFMLNGFLKNLIILPPPFVELLENKFFMNYFKCIKSEQNPLMRVYFTTRSTNIAKWNFKTLDANDCRVLNKMIQQRAPELIDIYGEHVVPQIIVAKAPHRKMFLIMLKSLYSSRKTIQ
uniref:Uncharacterized protein n=1 Tax=Rhodnius prolixus TaxID=13249 RepID=T1I8X6_RHOPR